MSDEPIPAPTNKPTLSRPEDQSSWAVGTNTYTFVLTGQHTDGKFAFFDRFFLPKGHVGPHCHGYEEMLCVLGGELTVFCADRRHVLRENTALNIPAWAPHMLHNNSGAPVRIVVTTAPAKLERQFEEIGRHVATQGAAPPPMSKQEEAEYPALMKVSSKRHLARLLLPDTFDHLLTNADRES